AASWAAARAAARAAADAAAKAAAWATARAASWDAAMSRHADMIRARVSWADVEAQLTTRGACECGADDVCALARRAQEAEVRADEQAAELHRLLKALTGLVTEIEALIAESHGV